MYDLTTVVTFKEKFYPRSWARYDLAQPSTLKLVPNECRLNSLEYLAI